jgi:hypothetical protein
LFYFNFLDSSHFLNDARLSLEGLPAIISWTLMSSSWASDHLFVGHTKNGVRKPFLETGIVAELLEQLRVVGEHFNDHLSQSAAAFSSQDERCKTTIKQKEAAHEIILTV